MLVRREVFDAVGLLAEEFFFGFEDLDFCLRASAAGFRTACVHGAVVRHEGQASIGRASSTRAYYAVRNHLLVASRSARGGRWLRTTSVLALNVAHVLFTSGLPRIAGLVAVARGARDHFRGRYGAAG